MVTKVGSCRHYQPLSHGLKTVSALVVLREKVIQPLLAGIATSRLGRKPKNWSSVDQHYETLRLNMRTLLQELGVAVWAIFCECRQPKRLAQAPGRIMHLLGEPHRLFTLSSLSPSHVGHWANDCSQTFGWI